MKVRDDVCVQGVDKEFRKWCRENGGEEAKEAWVESVWDSGLMRMELDNNSCSNLRCDMKVFHSSGESSEVVIGLEYVCKMKGEDIRSSWLVCPSKY